MIFDMSYPCFVWYFDIFVITIIFLQPSTKTNIVFFLFLDKNEFLSSDMREGGVAMESDKEWHKEGEGVKKLAF